MPATLYLVATPIGNLADITQRAIETLRGVDIIACEDTRHTRKLLGHLGITGRLVSYHEHNETARAAELAAMLAEGKSVAVVSDAGTPGINDPGYRIVRAAIEIGARVESVPGPAAFVAAVVASGLATDAIFFGGFLPSRKGERRSRLAEAAAIPATLVFYETPHRVAPALADCLDVLGDRQAVIARELTKLYEEFIRGSLSELAARVKAAPIKGEIVLLIDRGTDINAGVYDPSTLADRVTELEAAGTDRKAALKQAAKEFGMSRSEAYRRLQNSKK
jgi:16S rRNA (cytidine1402-2'-O)-methyltransferase